MATGDKLCPNCNQWAIHCQCGWAAARQREQWNTVSAPNTAPLPPRDAMDWVYRPTPTAPAPGYYYTTQTIKTRKPRKRRHYRQVVY